MTIDLCKCELRAKRCPQPVLADMFLALLQIVKDVIASNPTIEARVEKVIEAFDAPVEVKATVKRKVAPKKKAPAKVVGTTSNLIYNPLFWVPTTGSPPSLADVREEVLPLDCRESCRYLSIDNEGVTSFISCPSDSVYSISLPAAERSYIHQATHEMLKSWFLKKKDRAISEIREEVKAPVPTTRPSMLGSSLAQRFGILIYSLKKTCGSSMEEVENAILSCSLGENEVGLLSESLQNVQDNDELKGALASIDKFLEEKTLADLYDDERFVHFIARVPNIKERMCCLYVAFTFKTVAEQLCARMDNIRTALNLLVLNPRLHMIHQLVLSVGNELNLNHATRSGLKYFRLSTFDKLTDLKGKDGMSLAMYLSHFTPPVCDNEDERKFLSKAAQLGVMNTYNATKDLINTYMILAGAHKNSSLIPKNSPHFPQDCYQETTRAAAERLLPEAQALVRVYYSFLAAYTTAVYFFGDPNTLLPLDQSGNKADDEGGPNRDLLQRYMTVIQMFKPPRKRQFEVEEKCLPPVEKTPVSRTPVLGMSAARPVSMRQAAQLDPASIFKPPVTAAPPVQALSTSLSENMQPSQKRIKTSTETPFGAVACPTAPSSRRLMTLRGRVGARLVRLPAPPPALPTQDGVGARSSISNTYSLARDLNHPPSDLGDC